MNTVKTFVTRLIKDEGGAGMVEYALLLALIGVILIATLIALSGGIQATMNTAIVTMGGTAAPGVVNPLGG